MKPQKIILIISLIISTFSFAQNDLKARIELEEAEKQFIENNFTEALEYLGKTETLIGKWTPKVSFMKIECLNNIADLEKLESENTKKLRKEVKLYIDYYSVHKENVVMEKFKIVYAIDENIKQFIKQSTEAKSPEFLAASKAFKEKKYALAMDIWNKLAVKGNSAAMCEIANLYNTGNGVLTDKTKSMEWYIKAADKGNITGIYEIGSSYSYGYGVIEDDAQAIEWYLKAAEKGSVKAMDKIGLSYFLADGVEMDHDKSLEWWLKASNKGNGGSMYNIAMFIYHFKKDNQNTMIWLKKSVDNGYWYGMCKIGQLYYDGEGVAKDYSKALEWYLKAAEKGENSMNDIAYLYYNGQGVTRDYSKAMEWYLKGGHIGNGDSMNAIGLLYSNGQGVTQDYAKAMEWYLKAVDAKYYYGGKAQDAIGLLYYNGQGVTKDYLKAIEWFEKAYIKGNLESLKTIVNIYNKGGYGVKKDNDLASRFEKLYEEKLKK